MLYINENCVEGTYKKCKARQKTEEEHMWLKKIKNLLLPVEHILISKSQFSQFFQQQSQYSRVSYTSMLIVLCVYHFVLQLQ